MAAAATCNPSSAFLLFLLSCPASLGTPDPFLRNHLPQLSHLSATQCVCATMYKYSEGARGRGGRVEEQGMMKPKGTEKERPNAIEDWEEHL